MTTFLWTVVILMGAALLAEVIALVGMALLAARVSRRTTEISEQYKRTLEPSIVLAKELRQSIQPLAETIAKEGKEIATLVTARARVVQAVYCDTTRRAERIRLRLTKGVHTIQGQPPRRGVYRQVVEPVQTASQVVRGLKLALWLFRRVA
jgi:hypothetical protein